MDLAQDTPKNLVMGSYHRHYITDFSIVIDKFYLNIKKNMNHSFIDSKTDFADHKS